MYHAARFFSSAAVSLLLLLASLTSIPALSDATPAPPDAVASDGEDGWNVLLDQCVRTVQGGGSTAVDYRCMSMDSKQLSAYLDYLSGVSESTFNSWSRDARLAFLINAYNAWTVKLILTSYPDLESIRDLGSFLRSPWKKEFIPLLGETVSLDDIEHGMIRKPGVYDEPRIHFAVNCASVGCPALRREAFTAADLEAQLEAQTRQFLGDRSRNRLRNGTLEVSSLFKWYREDFEGGWRGAESLEEFLALYRDALNLTEEQTRALRGGRLPIDFLDYDWSLNDLR